MGEPEPWRRTGRKAKGDHFIGLTQGVLVEFTVYDNKDAAQGRAVCQLQSRGDEMPGDEGETWLAKVLAIEDDYFKHWYDSTYGLGPVPIHVCARQAHSCRVQTVFRNPLHMDVFRLLPGRSALKVKWYKDEEKQRITDLVDSLTPAGGLGGDPPGQAVGSGGVVQVGQAGIDGLARALGSGEAAEGAEPVEPAPKKARTSNEPKAEARTGEEQEGLRGVLDKRSPSVPEVSALKMVEKKKKKKKKSKKSKKKDKKEKEDESSSSESSSSSGGSLFQVAALPQGVDKLQKLHAQKPGWLANVTLRRFSELLNRNTGGGNGSANVSDLPPVARAYLTQIYLVKNPEHLIGLRNLRELRPLATLVDYLANNDSLRALDIALQRMKAIEVFIAQASWTQATQLELIPAETEQRAWFAQELKAAQQEVKAENKMYNDQWPRRRTRWEDRGGGAGPSNAEKAKEGEGDKGDHPPSNGSKGRKGKGKGKKGKRW